MALVFIARLIQFIFSMGAMHKILKLRFERTRDLTLSAVNQVSISTRTTEYRTTQISPIKSVAWRMSKLTLLLRCLPGHMYAN